MAGPLLRLHPPAFRRDRGEEVRAFVEAEARRARRRVRLAHARFLARTTLDLANSAARLRLRPVLPGAGGAGGRGRPGAGIVLDLRQAARGLRRTPLVTGVVVATLALCVGLNTAVFSVVDAILLRPLGYPAADRLVEIRSDVTAEGVARANFSGGDVRDLREGVDALEDAFGVTVIRQNLTGAGLPRQVAVGWASGNMPAFLGVEPVVGRAFTPDDPPGTVLLGHRLWVDHFGSDPAVVGRALSLDGHPHTVVGVLPPGFRVRLPAVPDDAELWKNPDAFWTNGDIWSAQGPGFALLRVMGRLRPGASMERLREELAGLQADLRGRYPEYERSGLRLSAVPLRRALTADVRDALVLLSAAVVAVLLIGCGNVAGILLVRARGRRRELAVRRALGAGRGRLGSLVMAEGMILALLGCGGGLVLAALATELLVGLAPPLPRADGIGVDRRVLLFALATAALSTVAVGLLPAWRATRADPARGLAGGRTVAGERSGRLREALVAGQIALSLVLLVAAGLLSASLVRLAAVAPGFDSRDVLTFSVSLPGSRYDRAGAGRFLVRLEDRLDDMAGVESAGVMWPVPFGSRWQSRYEAGAVEGQSAWADYRVGTAGFFETLGVAVEEGRLIREGDPRTSIVVSRSVAERAWPGRTAVGRTVRANPWGGNPADFEVVGVVSDVLNGDLREPPPGALYFDVRGWAWTDWEFDVVVRTAGAPTSLVPAIREALAELDPPVPQAHARGRAARLADEVAPERFALSLVGLFGVAAAVLALVGLYGTIAHSVAQRSREIGVRLALGSGRGDVMGRVVGRGMRLVAAGVALGLPAAVAASGLLRGWLFGVGRADPTTYAAVVLGVALLGLVATWVPARRAARTDPVEVLRTEQDFAARGGALATRPAMMCIPRPDLSPWGCTR